MFFLSMTVKRWNRQSTLTFTYNHLTTVILAARVRKSLEITNTQCRVTLCNTTYMPQLILADQTDDVFLSKEAYPSRPNRFSFRTARHRKFQRKDFHLKHSIRTGRFNTMKFKTSDVLEPVVIISFITLIPTSLL